MNRNRYAHTTRNKIPSTWALPRCRDCTAQFRPLVPTADRCIRCALASRREVRP